MVVPIYDPKLFNLKEIEENNLPRSITGYAEATCGGSYPYVPPPGYRVISCQSAGMGTHGGCPYCIMSRVTCAMEPDEPPVTTPPPTTQPPADTPTDTTEPTTDITTQPKSSTISRLLLLVGVGVLAYGAYKYLKS